MSVYAEIYHGERNGWGEDELECLRNYAAHEAYEDEMRYRDECYGEDEDYGDEDD